MKVDVLNTEGKSTGRSVELPESIFGIEPNEHVLYLAVKQYNAHQRQGTHKSKERGEIAGSTKKLKRQKGTGTARAGSIKSPVFRGGGRVFGPRPRTYDIKLNKKVNRLARASALSHKLKNGELKIVEDFTMDVPKTKAMKSILDNLSKARKKVLVTGDYDKAVFMSGRNLNGAGIYSADDLNTYAILNANEVILTEASIVKLTELLAN